MTVGGELHRLMESGDYWGCLARGKAMLEQEPLADVDRARVLQVLCRCHLALGQHEGAVAAGRLAADLAERHQQADLAGNALVLLARAQVSMRRYPEALATLERFRQGLPEYTAALCLEGAAMQLTGEVLARLGRPEGAVDWYSRAHHWFHRYGDEESAGDSLLALIDLALSAGDLGEAARRLAEAEARGDSTPTFAVRLLLARARYLQAKGEEQPSVDAAYQAFLRAEHCSPLQVEAQLHLSRMAEVMGRPVDGLSFALAARISAIDGRLYALEFEASAWLIHLIRRHGPEPVAELAEDLGRQGLDLYQYLDPEAVERLARGE